MVEHVNRDGMLPTVDIHSTASKSVVYFVLCFKTSSVETSNAFTEAKTPFVVLGGQVVSNIPHNVIVTLYI